VGYLRYDTDQELAALAELYRHLRLYVNFFQPQMKLVSKTRHGAKVSKRYDVARTPTSGSWPLPSCPRKPRTLSPGPTEG
jgi:hypothetical protein